MFSERVEDLHNPKPAVQPHRALLTSLELLVTLPKPCRGPVSGRDSPSCFQPSLNA